MKSTEIKIEIKIRPRVVTGEEEEVRERRASLFLRFVRQRRG